MPASVTENMQLAIAVVADARAKVPNSSNYESSSSPIGALFIAADSEVTALRETTTEIDRRIVARGALTPAMRQEAMVAHARAAIAAKCGNCGELSEVAAYLLLQKRVRSIDRVAVMGHFASGKNANILPHAFTVIGRSSTGIPVLDGDIGLPNTWGAAAVICDPWDRVAYPASLYARFWTKLEEAKGTSPRSRLWCKLLGRYG